MASRPHASDVSKLALGTVQFGLDYGVSNSEGKTSSDEVKEILRVAHLAGIGVVDTAHAYGSSEEVLGQTMNGHFQVVSKFPALDGQKTITDYLNQSLERLQVDHLYAFIAHGPEVLKQKEKHWAELKLLKEQGKISKIGYSLYTPQELEFFLSEAFIPDLVQLPYNIFDRRFERMFKKLKEHGVEIHTRSAFLQGLFFVNPETLPNFFDPAKIALRELRSMFPSEERRVGVLLNFCVSNRYIDKVVIGVNNAEQLRQNIKSLLECDSIGNLDQFEISNESILLPYQWPKKEKL